jgi:hypothetical protein
VVPGIGKLLEIESKFQRLKGEGLLFNQYRVYVEDDGKVLGIGGDNSHSTL